MFKKSDVLPLILALISTAVVLGVGFLWFTRINIASTTSTGNSDTPSQGNTSGASNRNFSAPDIVPMGTAITINDSTRMGWISQALKKSFHKQFPGTAVITDAEGSKMGMELLHSGEIDLAAIDRPLNKKEKERGLAAVNIYGVTPDKDNDPAEEVLYYVYQKPASDEVLAFLGYALSSQGQEAIFER